jgi:TolB-like protein
VVDERGALVANLAGVNGTRENRVPVPEHSPLHDREDLHMDLLVTGDTVATQPSVGVLPFTDLTAEHDQAYLCEGIAEELIHALSAIDGLKVSARSSSFQFAGKALNIREVGARLGVATILEGSIRTADRRLRLTARLVSVSDGYQLWSERYDRTLDDVFAVQDEIGRAIAAKLQVTLHTAPGRTSTRRHTEDLEAYSLYLQGRHYWSRRVKGSFQRATACFEQAIARDPSYALAHAGLADVYITLGLYGGMPPRAARSKAKPAAQQALLLNDELSEAHQATASIDAFFEWDFVAAEREFRSASSGGPSGSGRAPVSRIPPSPICWGFSAAVKRPAPKQPARWPWSRCHLSFVSTSPPRSFSPAGLKRVWSNAGARSRSTRVSRNHLAQL